MHGNQKRNSTSGARRKNTGDSMAKPSPLGKVVDELVASPNPVPGLSTAKCSLCGVPFVREQSKAFPFCSSRCQLIDLHGWFNEKFGLPVESQDDHAAPNPDDEQE